MYIIIMLYRSWERVRVLYDEPWPVYNINAALLWYIPYKVLINNKATGCGSSNALDIGHATAGGRDDDLLFITASVLEELTSWVYHDADADNWHFVLHNVTVANNVQVREAIECTVSTLCV